MTTNQHRAGTEMSQTTGTYDREAAGRQLTETRTAQLAADPFATTVPQGWALVWAQTHEDPETGAMTLPLVGHGFTEASVLATHPDVAVPVGLALDEHWTIQRTPARHCTDAELLAETGY